MSKHTPAPWLGRGKSDSVHRPCDTHPYGDQIFAFHPDYAPNDADHALILAAPKLLAALEVFADPEIIAQLEGCAEDGVRRTDDDWAKFRLLAKHYRAAAAAVAEAKGERP